MIYKIEEGLYKVELATKIDRPNVNGSNYDVDSLFRAIDKMPDAFKVLTKSHQPSISQGDLSTYTSIILDDILGSVTEVHYEVDEPYMMIESSDDIMKPFMEEDCYAGARLLADVARNSELLIITHLVCWDIVSDCNWK